MSSLPPCPSCDSTDNNSRWGHEVQGVYDGILYWSCTACGHTWPRDFGAWVGLQHKADAYVAELLRSMANHPSRHG